MRLKTTFTLAILSLLWIAATSQTNNHLKQLSDFAGNLVRFNSNNPQEKVYLQFDNKAYYLGETMWFSGFVVDAGTLQPISKSTILYVELISPFGDIIETRKLKIVGGRCCGEFLLVGKSETYSHGFSNTINVLNELKSGYYEVRAYTNSMQDFSPEICFSRVFPIYDAPAIDGDFAQISMTTTSTKRMEKEKRPETKKGKKLDLSFFPEGGDLIVGIPSLVAFKATDEFGRGINIEGNVDGDNTKFNSRHLGMGSFIYTPTDAKKRDVKIEHDGKIHTFELPLAKSSGLVINTDNSDDNTLRVKINRSSNSDQLLTGATVMCRGRLVYFDTIQWEGTSSKLNIDKTKFPAGVQQLTLFTKDGKILGERLFFSSNNLPSNLNIDLKSDKKEYKPYEKIKVTANVTDENNTPVSTFLSLAIRDADIENGGYYADNILTDFLLSSDLKGYIENPDYYFHNNEMSRKENLDLLMLVQGWRRYEWETMSGQKPFIAKHYTEDKISVDGQVLSRTNNKPTKDIQVMMRALSPDGSLAQSNSMVSDENGEFNFGYQDFMGRWRLILILSKQDSKLAKNTRIRVNRGTTPDLRSYLPIETTVPAPIINYPSTIGNNTDMRQVEDFLVLSGITIKEDKDYLDCEMLPVRQDCEDILDSGKLLGDVGEYLMKKSNSDFILEATDKVNYNYKNRDIILLPLRIKNTMWSSAVPPVDPAQIDLEEVDKILFFHNTSAYRHINIAQRHLDTKTSEQFLDNKLKYLALIYPRMNEDITYQSAGQRVSYVDGYSKIKDFYSPQYSNADLPVESDYRRTLYWNPALRTDDGGNAEVMIYNNARCRIMEMEASTLTPSGKIGNNMVSNKK